MWIKIDFFVLLLGILLLLMGVYLESGTVPLQLMGALPPAPNWIPPIIEVVVFGLGVTATFYTDYILLRRMIPKTPQKGSENPEGVVGLQN